MSRRPKYAAIIIEDDPSWQQIIAEILGDLGLGAENAENLEDAANKIRHRSHRLAVVDLSLGGRDHHNQDGIRILQLIRQHDPDCVPILLTGFATVELAVEAIKRHGALTCLRKEEFKRGQFIEIVQEVLAITQSTAGKNAPGDGTLAIDSEAGAARRKILSGRALIVEDDAGWSDLFAELLAESGFEVTLSRSFVEALGKIRQNSFQVAVVDLSLASSLEPDQNRDGYRLLDSTRQAGIPTLIVSGNAEPELIEKAYEEHGIFACLEKQGFERQAFKEAVQLASLSRLESGRLSGLTRRELEVLTLLAQGLSNKEIARQLFVTKNTVKRHVKSIFAKLDVHNRAAATAIAIGENLIP